MVRMVRTEKHTIPGLDTLMMKMAQIWMTTPQKRNILVWHIIRKRRMRAKIQKIIVGLYSGVLMESMP
jgi:hypothetical protein